MSDLVTGDAVVVDVQIAQLPIRAAAFLLDFLVQTGSMIAIYLLLSNTITVVDPALLTALLILFTVLVFVGYPVLTETLTRGRTLGKIACGLRVVGDDGSPELFRQALFRALSGFVEIYTLSGGPAVICSLISPKGKRLGDVFAGTMVISERGPRNAGPPPQMPPQLAGWAATLELSQLPEELIHTARQYLARWRDLSPAVQHEMGTRIAARMTAFVAPPPPPGVPPHAYLSAVLAERRERHLQRLLRRAAARATTPAAAPYLPAQPHTAAPRPHQGYAAAQPYAAASQPNGPAPRPHGPAGGGFTPPA
ncbi:hypothetical protein GCM10010156_67080 [Planobispora rosea]|uniref:RDD domain-containing protein n=1 Tax=Planobispora rosea TaxID=35762 RepID=A0A8J3WG20_PLARO|nr:RDD family protein [Planobispora rosea]GGS99590.1 hypothetical protein GCM10010156_67080 [Planobispora rosea]GIH88070.1 hypothetical protein Pro02_64780 [Planobispora rosea]